MGRFDALTQLDAKKPQPPAPAAQPDTLKARLPESPKSGIHENPKTGKPVNLLSGNPVTLKSGIHENLKHEKYSTLLQRSLIKQIKQFALAHDMKDYEVIHQAMTAFFEKNA